MSIRSGTTASLESNAVSADLRVFWPDPLKLRRAALSMGSLMPETHIRLLLLADLALFRACLAYVLRLESGFEVVAECGTFDQALEALQESRVDVVLLDPGDGETDGRDFMAAAHEAGYQGAFPIVAALSEVRASAALLKLGASGIFLKTESPGRLVQAMRHVGNGGVWIDQTIIAILAERLAGGGEPPDSAAALGEREREVLRGIVRG